MGAILLVGYATASTGQRDASRGIFFVPLSCGGGYWSHEGDVPGYNTIGAVSSDGHTTVVLSINSNVDDPVLAAEYRLIDHAMCNHGHHRDNS